MKILLRGKNEQMLKVALNSLPCGNLMWWYVSERENGRNFLKGDGRKLNSPVNGLSTIIIKVQKSDGILKPAIYRKVFLWLPILNRQLLDRNWVGSSFESTISQIHIQYNVVYSFATFNSIEIIRQIYIYRVSQSIGCVCCCHSIEGKQKQINFNRSKHQFHWLGWTVNTVIAKRNSIFM